MVNRLHAMADGIVLLYGWRRALVAWLAGAATALTMPPFFFFPLLWVTLPILVLLLDGADADPSAKQMGKRWRLGSFFQVGWWFGFGFFLTGLYWIAQALTVDSNAHGWLIPFALVLIPGGLALFVALACSLAGFFWSVGFARLGVLASFLVLFEWLRGVVLTGFPWNGFHAALGAHDSLIQGFSLVGPHGASLFVLLVAMAPAALWPGHTLARGRVVALASCLILALAWTGFGMVRLQGAKAHELTSVSVRIVQPNIAQADKWNPDLREAHIRSLLELTTRRARPDQLGLLNANLVVWPESAFPFLLTQRPDVLVAIGSVLPLGSELIAGAIREEVRNGTERVFYNSIYALNARGEIADAYDKVRLVPFGEQLPFARWLDRMGIGPLVSAPQGFAPGPGPGTLSAGTAPTGLALVCYEAIFPSFVRAGVVAHDPAYLVNVTNDAWFGTSAGPHQHFHQARFRTVEMGLPMVRAANTGISAVLDAYGRTISSLPIGAQGVVDANLPQRLETTLYQRFGDGLFGAMLVLILIASIYHSRMKRARPS